jgi:hypothetical protein
MTAPAALAQERQPVVITEGRACGTVTLTFANPVATTHGFRWNAVPGDGSSDGVRTGLVVVGPGATVKETVRYDEDEFDGVAALTVAVAFGPDSDIQPRLDLYPVDTDCSDEPTPTPTPTPTPEPTPEPTTPPATTTPPPATVVPDVDVDVDVNNDVVVPRGGVATGGGPA